MNEPTPARDDAPGENSAPDSTKAPLASIVAPALAFGATLVAKKVLTTAYRGVTGKDAPSGRDRSAALGSVLAWAAITAATSAVIEVAIFRATARVLDE